MAKDYVEILGIYPGMYASKFIVRTDSWEYYLNNMFNSEVPGTCFLPCQDAEGDSLFVDITKLLAFYVLESKEPKKEKPKKEKKKKEPK